MKILGITGSLRKNSLNTTLLKAAQEMVSPGTELEIYVPDKLPLFIQELEKDLPQEFIDYKKKIDEADAIIFASPEHNHTIPAVLKNAIEWGSRPEGQSSWYGKTIGIMGASSGVIATARAQMHLREVIFALKAKVVGERLEVLVAKGQDKIDENGKLVHEYTIAKIKELLGALEKEVK